MDLPVMGVDCLKCVNSGCCKLEIYVDREEYDSLDKIVKDNFTTRTEEFIRNNPKYKGKEENFDEMYFSNFATMAKSSDGYCPLLDRETMLCSIYPKPRGTDIRPKACQEFEAGNKKCLKIRELRDE